MKKIFLLAPVFLYGCLPAPPSALELEHADYGLPPINTEIRIKDILDHDLLDPDSVKFSEFKEPKKTYFWVGDDRVFGYSVCVSYNAKNTYGGYVGYKYYAFFFKDNKYYYSIDINKSRYNFNDLC